MNTASTSTTAAATMAAIIQTRGQDRIRPRVASRLRKGSSYSESLAWSAVPRDTSSEGRRIQKDQDFCPESFRPFLVMSVDESGSYLCSTKLLNIP